MTMENRPKSHRRPGRILPKLGDLTNKLKSPDLNERALGSQHKPSINILFELNN